MSLKLKYFFSEANDLCYPFFCNNCIMTNINCDCTRGIDQSCQSITYKIIGISVKVLNGATLY